MDRTAIEREYGDATLDPETDAVVGTYRTWEITYTVGELGMDDGSEVKVAAKLTSDWGDPQFDDPTAANYATVEATGSAAVTATYQQKIDGSRFHDTFLRM